MTFRRFLGGFVLLALGASAGAAAYLTRERWLPLVRPAAPDAVSPIVAAPPADRVLLSEQAQKNLHLTAAPLKSETFWKTITVPGLVVDRPGATDRGLVSPVTGVVSRIVRTPGDTVRPGEVLFSIRLLSESLHLTQTELYKAVQEARLTQEQRARLAALPAGAASESRLIELDNQLARQEVAATAYRLDLQNRGLLPEQIAGVAAGKFVAEVTVAAPPDAGAVGTAPREVQELKVELGQLVQAGQTLCLLADHRLLAIEGRAFRAETSLVERAVREGWSFVVDFQEDPAANWPTLTQPLAIRTLSNSIDPATRTFTFLIPFENQWRALERDGRTLLLWRFRPGHPVRLQLRVEQLENVFVLPTEAVVREGAEAYVFRQNGDTFERKPVHVVFQDRKHAVLANDGSVAPGVYVARTGAAQLNRMLKSASGGGLPPGFHMHADGSVHGAH